MRVLLVIGSPGNNRIWTFVHRTWNSLRHLNCSCEESGQELEEQKTQKTFGLLNWTETGKGTYTRVLCQKNEGSKERPIKMSGRTIYRTLTYKDTSSNWDWQIILFVKGVKKKMNQPQISYDCEAIAYLRYSHLGQFLWNQMTAWRPYTQSPMFHSECRNDKDATRMGKHNRSLEVAVQGPDNCGPHLMHAFIHSFIHCKLYTRSDNKVRELTSMCLPWQQWTETSVWFDDAGISAFHSCVVVDL
jgi:hypothetical protein